MVLVRICRSTCDGDLYSVAGAAGVSVRAGGTALGSYACRFDNHRYIMLIGPWLHAAAAEQEQARSVSQISTWRR